MAAQYVGRSGPTSRTGRTGSADGASAGSSRTRSRGSWRSGRRGGAARPLRQRRPVEAPRDELAGDESLDPAADVTHIELIQRFAWHYQLDIPTGELEPLNAEERLDHLVRLVRSRNLLPADGAGPSCGRCSRSTRATSARRGGTSGRRSHRSRRLRTIRSPSSWRWTRRHATTSARRWAGHRSTDPGYASNTCPVTTTR
ncbi:hypothetical protein NKG94_22080 [Micromonospora sp. M12]